MAGSGNLPVLVLLLLASLSSAQGGVVEVCNGDLTYTDCSNCCSLKKGCVYLQPGSGQVTCIGGDSRACTRECQGPKLAVCPLPSSGFPTSGIKVLKGKLPPRQPGCGYYNIVNGDPIPRLEQQGTDQGNRLVHYVQEAQPSPIELMAGRKCKLDSIVEVCNAEVSKDNCGCCFGKSGCIYLENPSANSTCLPTEDPMGVCALVCLPRVSICAKSVTFQGTTLQSCRNARRSCEDMKEGCSLYDRNTGADLCAAGGIALPV
ncbi:hypothetical protein SELMODRAFT_446573 [Selaginella moellendorffii]|uniref:Uncharacterized protein n=1 Tax=Selaginella moellendorffii TaxID=88036 RepID=D8SSI2_SELML|nr:uncharacterized protein LOC9648705 isoform X1 [Selaginella moellendorffii]XP_002986368.1 uncharacterized protein LOC9649237 isoform X1 [Selaginella moellendorffii]XP_024515993.1 uncharacterized protein LOC112340949 isoform X1 [Selaginella moellendorffii]XP_024515994.1 uncharacterized protein LOC112340949 isoform X1 [Selaginella moellendorffii]EFJ12575.1 hypothetical protein SELMODRAFT_425256 [Selaginella moellendorffii]EFJ12577.1 hypothetical protein SELMODRAFT_446573 [Selaginella moellendo|eukprot:XP_002986366.1 uncharacterized protein LOC9648705 isoform X1 [Selaginella moellendorffii]